MSWRERDTKSYAQQTYLRVGGSGGRFIGFSAFVSKTPRLIRDVGNGVLQVRHSLNGDIGAGARRVVGIADTRLAKVV